MKFTVDPPELHKVATKLSSLADDYEQVYTSLLNAAGTMGDAWRADDNLAYVDQINGFCQELKDMTAHLRQTSEAMDKIARNYEDTRDHNITSVKQLAN